MATLQMELVTSGTLRPIDRVIQANKQTSGKFTAFAGGTINKEHVMCSTSTEEPVQRSEILGAYKTCPLRPQEVAVDTLSCLLSDIGSTPCCSSHTSVAWKILHGNCVEGAVVTRYL